MPFNMQNPTTFTTRLLRLQKGSLWWILLGTAWGTMALQIPPTRNNLFITATTTAFQVPPPLFAFADSKIIFGEEQTQEVAKLSFLSKPGVLNDLCLETGKETLQRYQAKTECFDEREGANNQRLQSGELLTINQEGELFESVDETSLEKGTIATRIQEAARQKDSWLDKATSMSFQDWTDKAVLYSRPQKKPISFHSLLSTFSAVAGLIAVLPLFDPQWHGFDGLPQIFDFRSIPLEIVRQCQMVAVLSTVSSILGMFRLPANSPEIRRIGMSISASSVAFFGLVTISILGGASDLYLIDIFSPFGRLLSGGLALWTIQDTLDVIHCTYTDESMEGFDTVPGMSSRWGAVFQAMFLTYLAFVKLDTLLPVLGDRQDFEMFAMPFYQSFNQVEGHYGGFLIAGPIFPILSTGLSAFLATMQYEKKISPTKSTVLLGIITVFFTWDLIKGAVKGFLFPDLYMGAAAHTYFQDYVPDLFAKTHFAEIFLAGAAMAHLVALGRHVSFQEKRIQEERLQTSE